MSAPDPDQFGLIQKYGGWAVTLVGALITASVAVVGGFFGTIRNLRHSKADKEQVDRLHTAVLDLYKKRDGILEALTEHTQRDEDNMNRLHEKIDKKFDGLTSILLEIKK